jgi:septum formation protein
MQLTWQERSLVAVVPFAAAELDEYLATRSWRGHSGGYAIMEEGDPHVRVVEGSVSNVIGLPMETAQTMLNWFAGISCQYSV